jgi:hypothetical protein
MGAHLHALVLLLDSRAPACFARCAASSKNAPVDAAVVSSYAAAALCPEPLKTMLWYSNVHMDFTYVTPPPSWPAQTLSFSQCTTELQ